MDDEQERVKEEGAELWNISGYIYIQQCSVGPVQPLKRGAKKRKKKASGQIIMRAVKVSRKFRTRWST